MYPFDFDCNQQINAELFSFNLNPFDGHGMGLGVIRDVNDWHIIKYNVDLYNKKRNVYLQSLQQAEEETAHHIQQCNLSYTAY